MTKFKVGDRVTAGVRFGGLWPNLVVIGINPYGNLGHIHAKSEEWGTALFKEEELELIPPVKDEAYFKAKADEYRELRKQVREIHKELEGEGFTLYWKNKVATQMSNGTLDDYDFRKTVTTKL